MEERKKEGTREWRRVKESVCVWSGEECVCEGGRRRGERRRGRRRRSRRRRRREKSE